MCGVPVDGEEQDDDPDPACEEHGLVAFEHEVDNIVLHPRNGDDDVCAEQVGQGA